VFLKNLTPKLSKALDEQGFGSEEETNDDDDDQVEETIKSSGCITSLDLSMSKGVISRKYQFEIEKFCVANHGYSVGTMVDFTAEKYRQDPFFTVTSMSPKVSQVAKENEELRFQKQVRNVQVNRIDRDDIIVVWDTSDRRSSSQHLRIDDIKHLLPQFPLMKG